MQKCKKIIIGISIAVAVALIIGLIIFFHKRVDSSDPNDSESSTTEEDVDEAEDPSNSSNPDSSVTNNNQSEPKDVLPPKGSTNDDWLYTDGNKIVDKDGKEVWLTGLNWFGYNTGTNTFDGLWTCDLNTSLSQIADHGFNIIRSPFSSELILQWKKGKYPKANYNEHVNSYLNDKNSLEIFDYVVEQCRANGIKIMIDIHSAETNPSGHMAQLWYSNKIYPKNVKANKDYSSKNDADYHNTWWSGNLRGVKDFPVELGKHQNKLVYSPHDYGPAVYAQPWFNKNFTMDSLYKDS